MDQRTILAVFLSLTIYYGWILFMGPPPEPVLETPVVEEPVQSVEVVRPAPTHDAPVREVPFSACELDSTITTDGGGLTAAKLRNWKGPYAVTPLYSWVLGLFTGEGPAWIPYGQAEPFEELVSSSALALSAGVGPSEVAERVRYEVVSASPTEVQLRGVLGNGYELQQTWSQVVENDLCMIQVDIAWTNTGGSVDLPLWFGMHDSFAPPGGMLSVYENTMRAMAFVDGGVEAGSWNDESDDFKPVEAEGPLSWFALGDKFFGMIVLAPEGAENAYFSHRKGADGMLAGVHWNAASSLPVGQTHETSARVYVGPFDVDVLAPVHEDLADVLDFGIFAFFAYPLLAALKFFQSILGNWGLAIIALTVCVKIVFYPLNQTALSSAEKMKKIQPLMNEIREKYKDNQQEQQRKTMELFQEHKVNPLGGCLPMVLQMPVFLALFWVLMYSVDLYQTEFLYLKDLTAPDPYCILPTIVVVMMLIQQQLTPMGNMDPAQARMMKMMPLMFGIFWFMFPSGLVVYYFVNTLLSILQQWWIRRTLAAASDTSVAAPTGT